MVFLYSITTTILITLSSLTVYAQDNRQPISQNQCTTIDYSSRFGPARNQGDTGACFAYSVADILSYELGIRVSALDILILHNMNREDAAKGLTYAELRPRAGWAAHALNRAFTHGVCSESETVSEPAGRDLNADLIMLESMPFNQVPSHVWSRIFSRLNHEQVRNVFHNYPVNQRISQLALQNCSNRVPVENLTWSQNINRNGIGGGGPLIPILNEALNQRIQIINYNSADLVASGEGGSHFSTVVGRRWNSNSNQCEFFIRNTWGTGNTGYANGIKTMNGYQWVDEAFFEKNLFEVLSLQSQNQGQSSFTADKVSF